MDLSMPTCKKREVGVARCGVHYLEIQRTRHTTAGYKFSGRYSLDWRIGRRNRRNPY